ncbi:MAG: hypothetical protein PHW79_07455 [Candidatus Marinimicrobia bacterium]|nr:hypothetical protein [Candidatus Neomarinimicrobiota bacterium]
MLPISTMTDYSTYCGTTTYDNADEVKVMALMHGFQMRLIPMNNTHHATMEELVIGKDLSWMDQYPAVHEPKVEYRTANNKKKLL